MTQESLQQIRLIIKAARCAADKHRNQRRKDAEASAYINPDRIGECTRERGWRGRCGHLWRGRSARHHARYQHHGDELRQLFDGKVTSIVLEITDDKALAKEVPKEEPVRRAPHISTEAKLVELADKICNLRDILVSPRADRSAERKQVYGERAGRVEAGLRGVHPVSEAVFGGLLARQSGLL